ncbi:MAG: hypothetical protein Q8L49_12885 [Burkholderiaceae bacterium]|nr:hypothetical protein [Burkholderiaceae bacterium]
MTRDSLKTAIARIAHLRSRTTYRAEKAKLLAELREVRQRGESSADYLAKIELDALKEELLGRRR